MKRFTNGRLISEMLLAGLVVFPFNSRREKGNASETGESNSEWTEPLAPSRTRSGYTEIENLSNQIFPFSLFL